jgi:GST-like protein
MLDARLEGREWVMGDEYTIADIALLGWVRNLIHFYNAADLVDYGEVHDVHSWLDRCLARPAVQRGLKIPSKD